MKLAEYLKINNLTQEAFAEIVGVTRPIITDIVNRKRNASVQMVKRIKEATRGQVTFEDLYLSEAPSRLKKEPKKTAIPTEAEVTGSERLEITAFVDSMASCDAYASQKDVCTTEVPRREVGDSESELSSQRELLRKKYKY